jgi:hypothetical protein
MQYARIQELTNSALLTKIIKLLKRKAVGGVGLATYKKQGKMHTKSWSGNAKEREKKKKKNTWVENAPTRRERR